MECKTDGLFNSVYMGADSKFFSQIIDEIRHSVSAIHNLPPDIQMAARLVYYDGLRHSFALSAALGAVATVAAFFVQSKGLQRSGEEE